MTVETKNRLLNELRELKDMIADYIPTCSSENNSQMKALDAIDQAERIIAEEFRYPEMDNRENDVRSGLPDDDEPLSPFDV